MNAKPTIVLIGFFLLMSCTKQTESLKIGTGEVTNSSKYVGPIIDIHLHAYTKENFWGPVPNPTTKEISVKNISEHKALTLKLLEKYNVVLSAVSSGDFKATDQWFASNSKMFLRGFQAPNPTIDSIFDQFKRLAEQNRIDVLGEIGAQYAGYSPSDSAFNRYWEIASAKDIPVSIHTGASFPGAYKSNPNFRLRYGDPLLLEDMLVKYPNLKVNMMHAGGILFTENAINMMRMYENAYADLGVLCWLLDKDLLIEFLKKAKRNNLLNKVMFGTDQMIWPEAIETGIERINALDFLTLDEKADIFYNNASNFLGLPQHEKDDNPNSSVNSNK